MNKNLFRVLVFLAIIGVMALRVVLDIWISEQAFELKQSAKVSIGNSVTILLYMLIAFAYVRLREVHRDWRI